MKLKNPFNQDFCRFETASHGRKLPFILLTVNSEYPSRRSSIQARSKIRHIFVMTQLVGVPAKDVWAKIEARERIRIISHLGVALKSLHSHRAPLSEKALNRGWQRFIDQQAEESIERPRRFFTGTERLVGRRRRKLFCTTLRIL